MFDIGWSELLVIAIVAIVVVGPKDLPRLMRGFGHYAGKLRRAAADFQRQFEEAVAESEADAVRKNIEGIRAGLDKSMMLPKEGAGPPAAMAPPAMIPVPVASPKPKRAPAKASSKQASSKQASSKQASAPKRRKTKAAP